MRRKKCPITKHTDRPIRGSSRVKCSTCGDVFPCRKPCTHIDCLMELGELSRLPDWIRPVPVVRGEQLELPIGGNS